MTLYIIFISAHTRVLFLESVLTSVRDSDCSDSLVEESAPYLVMLAHKRRGGRDFLSGKEGYWERTHTVAVKQFMQCIIISMCMGAFVKPFSQSTNRSDLAAEVGGPVYQTVAHKREKRISAIFS